MQLDEAAVTKLKDLLIDEQNPNLKLRVFVQGGGCAGFTQGFTFDEENTEDDFVYEYNGVVVIVDSISMQYIQGSTISFKEDAMGSSFVIDNPRATGQCGCGSSFSM